MANEPKQKPYTSGRITTEQFYEQFPNLKPADEKPQFTKYDAFGLAANTIFDPTKSLFDDIFGDKK